MSDFFATALASGVGFILAKIASAWFDARISKASAKEREWDQDLQEIQKYADDAISRGTEYWGRNGEHGDAGVVAQLSGAVATISAAIDRLFEPGSDYHDACTTELDRFDDVLTFGATASEDRLPDLEKLGKIHTQGAALKNKVKVCRMKQKPNWFG